MKKLTKLLAAMMVACLTMAGCAGGGGTDQKDQACTTGCFDRQCYRRSAKL